MRLLDRCHAQAIDEDRTRSAAPRRPRPHERASIPVPACTVGALPEAKGHSTRMAALSPRVYAGCAVIGKTKAALKALGK